MFQVRIFGIPVFEVRRVRRRFPMRFNLGVRGAIDKPEADSAIDPPSNVEGWERSDQGRPL